MKFARSFVRRIFVSLVLIRMRNAYPQNLASLSAIIFMSLPAMAFVIVIDASIALTFRSNPLFGIISKWVYLALIFIASIYLHYRFLIRDRESLQLIAEYDKGRTRTGFHPMVVALYLGLMPLLAFVLMARTS